MLMGNNFRRLSENEELGYFVDMYKITPQQFMDKYENELVEVIDLTDKLVIAVECGMDDRPITILGAYYPNEGHDAKLSYHGHISFIGIKNKNGNQIELLSKDDECIPQDFNEWFEMASENHCLEEDYEYYNKDYCLKLINTVIQGTTQDLSIEFKAEDIVVLEGL